MHKLMKQNVTISAPTDSVAFKTTLVAIICSYHFLYDRYYFRLRTALLRSHYSISVRLRFVHFIWLYVRESQSRWHSCRCNLSKMWAIKNNVLADGFMKQLIFNQNLTNEMDLTYFSFSKFTNIREVSLVHVQQDTS